MLGFIKWMFGPKENISHRTMEHSTKGSFQKNGRMIGGGHSQKNIDELKKREIEYKIEKTYSNGVRVGNVPSHKDSRKQIDCNQSWFPKHWNDGKIKRAGQTIARGAKKDGFIKSGHYGNVNVGVIRTNGKIATIFPMSLQKNKKGVEMYERKTSKRTSRKK